MRNDYRDRIGSHSQFDHERHWVFVRNTRLPRGTFGKRHSPDAIVFVVCVAIFLAMCAARGDGLDMSAHTPGPWRYEAQIVCEGDLFTVNGESVRADPLRGARHIYAGDLWVSEAHGPNVGVDDDTCLANASLIAAAPDLLEALRAFMDANTATDIRAAQRQGRAAIAKAEGKS